MLPSIARIVARIFHHHPVARHLGDDRGGGDRAALGVAVDDRFRRPLPARSRIAVDQHPGGFESQCLNRAGHRQHPRPVDVDLIDFLDRSHADAPRRAFDEFRVDRLALFERQILRIVDPARKFVAVEDTGGGDHRPRQRRAPRLVDAGERLREFELELEGTVPGHRVALCTPAQAGVQTTCLNNQQKI